MNEFIPNSVSNKGDDQSNLAQINPSDANSITDLQQIQKDFVSFINFNNFFFSEWSCK